MPTKAATDAWNRRHPEVKRRSVRRTQARKLISSDPLTTGDELQWAENAISIHELGGTVEPSPRVEYSVGVRGNKDTRSHSVYRSSSKGFINNDAPTC